MIFEATFTLEGILIFSSELRPMISAGESMGSYITPSPYIHNYPVMYGMLNKPAEAYFVLSSLHEAEYKGKKGLSYTSISNLLDDFLNGKEKSFYVFPLIPKKLNIMSFLMSSESWTYGLVRLRTKNVFPRLTSYSAFSVGSEFFSYVFTIGNIDLPKWIRIGKKRWGIMKVKYNKIEPKRVEILEQITASIPINLHDAEYFGYRYDLPETVMRTPSIREGAIAWAKLDRCFSISYEGRSICLPLPDHQKWLR
ncbi:type I-D CRISPR-associated protein Csc1 [Sulfolobus islandicus]|nr:type I-D CRISPR-associated protein Csc1 [Sulfolobus islandicus]